MRTLSQNTAVNDVTRSRYNYRRETGNTRRISRPAVRTGEYLSGLLICGCGLRSLKSTEHSRTHTHTTRRRRRRITSANDNLCR